MAKQGILHDYDLHANAEPSAADRCCAVCGAAPMTFQWSDYSGQAMCARCGCIYQLKWGTEEQIAEGQYPYLTLKPEWLPVLRRYFAETGRFTCLGTMLGPRPGLDAFMVWVDANGAAPQEVTA